MKLNKKKAVFLMVLISVILSGSLCLPEKGAYTNQSDCQSACQDGKCYYNYKTECWDCVKGCTVITPTPCSDPTKPQPKGCNYFPGLTKTFTAEDECESTPADSVTVTVQDTIEPPETEYQKCRNQGGWILKSQCEENCQKKDHYCLFNYKTGCWDCVERKTVITPSVCAAEKPFKGCDFVGPLKFEELEEKAEPADEMIDVYPQISNDFVNWYNANASFLPIVSDMVYNERINVYIEGIGNFYAITQEGLIVEHGLKELPDQTLNIYTDAETVKDLASGELSFEQALKEDKVIIEGMGIFNAIKFGLANLLFDIFALFSGPTDVPA